jgi:hypothetical protein
MNLPAEELSVNMLVVAKQNKVIRIAQRDWNIWNRNITTGAIVVLIFQDYTRNNSSKLIQKVVTS